MVSQKIKSALNTARSRIIEDAELAMPREKFEIFRKRTLNNLGEKGLEGELTALLSSSKEGYGNGRE